MSDILSDFTSTIRQYGLTPPDRIVADGRIHRFRSGPDREQNGFYRLTVMPAHQGGDIGFGLIGCWKRNLNEKWCSRKRGEISEDDRKSIRRQQAEQKKLDAAEELAAIERGKSIWAKAHAPSPDHAYLAAKRIAAMGIRQHKDLLVVPLYRDGGIVSLQFIAVDGRKRFLKGGSVEGAYGSVAAKSGDRSKIVIAEGYATAASLHQATGLPVVVAFNAGNLVPVAKAIRAKYPQAEIVIGADNDQFTTVRGKAVNVGIERAKEAANAIGARVSWPVFDKDDPEKPTDWNDYAARHGLEKTAAAFDARFPDPVWDEPWQQEPPSYMTEPRDYAPLDATPAPLDATPAPPDGPANERAAAAESRQSQDVAIQEAPSDWRSRLIPGKEVAEGHPYPFDGKSKTNAYLFLKHHRLFEGLLCYNEFTDAVMLTRRPPWEKGADSAPRRIRDDDFFMLAAHLEYCDITVSKETAADAAVRVAKEQSINPPREFFSRLKWDGKPRLDRWLTYYLGADDQPERYLALVGSKWLIGAVSRVFDPGCKFDSVLILEGKQGLGKSMVLRSLSTFGGEDFFLDSVGDIRSKDTLMTMQGKLIVEIAELASFKKSENEEIKAFITRQVDEYRPPYGRTVLRRPRYFVLAGSTNELDDGYLTDDTGNRRYWPVKCSSIDAPAMSRDAEQLWAEAVQRYRAGERTWLTPEEAAFSAREQKSRFLEDAWQERIADIVKNQWMGIRLDEVLDKLDMKPRDINNMVKKRVKNSLRQLGWVETRRPSEGRMWRPADSSVGTGDEAE